ncbi:MAG TPA: FtsX-like permease family protein [Terriglobales bacterium]|nr:FtsX-like permease family protein [Terriglobales bacterium]
MGRSREFAIRSALGANRSCLARQLLTESVILSLTGAGLGILIAFLGIRAALPAMPGFLPPSQDVSVNPPVLCTLMLSLVVGICLASRRPSKVGASICKYRSRRVGEVTPRSRLLTRPRLRHNIPANGHILQSWKR